MILTPTISENALFAKQKNEKLIKKLLPEF